jgi:hypothetical protein
MLSSSSVQRRTVRRFALGRWMVTPAAHAQLSGQSILTCFSRHATGDFGDVCHDDFEANLDAIAGGLRIVSVYRCDDKQGESAKVYVITEADRSVTTLLLAEEY